MRRFARWAHGICTGIGTATLLAVAAACGGDESTPAPKSTAPAASSGGATPAAAPAPEESAEDLVKRGERIYNVNCIDCHHRDPTQDGGLGPAVAGASYELLEARVLRGEYPPGYTPKKGTRLMVPLAHLEPEIGALAAYLGQTGS